MLIVFREVSVLNSYHNPNMLTLNPISFKHLMLQISVDKTECHGKTDVSTFGLRYDELTSNT